MSISRRNLIKASATGLIAAGGAAQAKTVGSKPVDAMGKALLRVSPRAEQAYIRRVKSAGANVLDVIDQPDQPTNNDLQQVSEFAGNFSKTFQHNEIGEVDPVSYQGLIDGLTADDFSNVQLSALAERKLVNPSAAKTFDVLGGDAHATRIAVSPSLTSAEGAAEMVEVYWQALTRDIPFSEYSTSTDILTAVTDLNQTSFPIGPRTNGLVTTDTLFRGSTNGDLTGPYISQLLYNPITYGAGTIEQRYSQPVAGNDFMDTFDEYLSIQNGALPTRGDVFEPTPRFIQTNRDLANYVHNDVLFQAYFNGTIILLGIPGSVTVNSPFAGSAVEAGFVSFGGPDIIGMVTTAGRMALTGAWFQKWRHLKLRPEAFGARIDVQRRGLKDYGIHPDVLVSEALARTESEQNNSLLKQAFPEGSPTHPAYPAGHACVAGACTTVMKAWFNESMVFPNPVIPSADGTRLNAYSDVELSIGGEINKLANNISIGRNAAGVHYRTDGEQGMLAGEQQALGLLRDYTQSYNNTFDGFELTRFDGTRVQIANGQITAL